MIDFKIILGSKSPRRQSLIAELGLAYEIRTKEVVENYDQNLPAKKVAEYLSKLKAEPLRDSLQPKEILLTSDTTVVLNNTVLGKPCTLNEAKEMLHALSGKVHEVVTGVCLQSLEKSTSFSVTTKVHFKNVTDAEIEYYVEKYKPLDKAGAYGIQEWIGQVGVEKIEGSYYNVVGLPVETVWDVLKTF